MPKVAVFTAPERLRIIDKTQDAKKAAKKNRLRTSLPTVTENLSLYMIGLRDFPWRGVRTLVDGYKDTIARQRQEIITLRHLLLHCRIRSGAKRLARAVSLK